MTDEQIVKGLEALKHCCDQYCNGEATCPYVGHTYCTDMVCDDAIALITRLIKRNAALQDHIGKLLVHGYQMRSVEKQYAKQRTKEVIKEFAQRLISEICGELPSVGGFMRNIINDIMLEMTEEHK